MAKHFFAGQFEPQVSLTPTTEIGLTTVSIDLSQMIAYSQQTGFTRLHLTGRKTLDVKETTDRIDELVRRAYSGIAR